MILDILTVLFFVLGFALILWMIGERRRDVLHYVTKSRAARDRLDRVGARKRRSEKQSSISNVADMTEKDAFDAAGRTARPRKGQRGCARRPTAWPTASGRQRGSIRRAEGDGVVCTAAR